MKWNILPRRCALTFVLSFVPLLETPLSSPTFYYPSCLFLLRLLTCCQHLLPLLIKTSRFVSQHATGKNLLATDSLESPAFGPTGGWVVTFMNIWQLISGDVNGVKCKGRSNYIFLPPCHPRIVIFNFTGSLWTLKGIFALEARVNFWPFHIIQSRLLTMQIFHMWNPKWGNNVYM